MGKTFSKKIHITDMADDGRGIGRILADDGSDLAGLTVFVTGAVYGDTVEAEITKKKKRYAEAVCRKVIAPSEYRSSEFPCNYLNDCGGCPYGALDYEMERKLKEKHIRDKLARIGGVENPLTNPINVGTPYASEEDNIDSSGHRGIEDDIIEKPLRYRNKAVMAIGLSKDGKSRNPDVGHNASKEVCVGFRKGKSHDIVDCVDCLIQMPTAMAVAQPIREAGLWVAETFSSATVRTSNSTGEVMVILDLKTDNSQTKKNSSSRDANQKANSPKYRTSEGIIPEFEELIYVMEEAILSIVADGDNVDSPYSLESVVVRGKELDFVAGKRTIMDRISGLDFEVSPDSFYQVNPFMVEKLYEKAIEYAEVQGANVLDIYCGVGTMGLIAAKKGAKNVVGIESVKPAIIDANRNAVINGIVNAGFICGKAEDVLRDIGGKYSELIGEEFIGNVDTVILDPPRTGCDIKVLEAISGINPKRIVYVSCNPATLARDIKFLTEKGFKFMECTPFNMFPRTAHTEVVAKMVRV